MMHFLFEFYSTFVLLDIAMHIIFLFVYVEFEFILSDSRCWGVGYIRIHRIINVWLAPHTFYVHQEIPSYTKKTVNSLLCMNFIFFFSFFRNSIQQFKRRQCQTDI